MRRKKDYKVLEEQCLEIIRTRNVLSMNGIAAFLEFSYEKFLEYRLNESKILSKAIEENRAQAKQQLMLQWLKPNASPTCQVALFKLLASEDERKVMGGMKKEDSSKDENSTKETYLKSLEEMGKEINAD